MSFASRRVEVLAFALVAAVVLTTSLGVPPRVVGDGAEYYLVAEAFVRHASPDLRPGDRESVRRLLDAEGLAGGDRLREVPEVTGCDGRLYGIHFWGYSLLTVPVRLAIEPFGTGALRSLQVTNALLLIGAFAVVLFQSPLQDGRRRALAALTVLSPALWFVLWPHPEVFSFSLTTVSIVWRGTGRRATAVLAAALASVQNPPLVLLALALWAEVLRDVWRVGGRDATRRAVSASLCLLPALGPCLFCLGQFGTFNLLTRTAARTANMSLGRTLELLFDANIGLLPYAPVVVVGSLWAALRSGGRSPAWVLAVAMSFLCTATCNWNSGTSGPARYAVWIYPLILYAFVGSDRGSDRPFGGMRSVAGLAIASQLLIVASRGGMLPQDDYLRHSALARFLLDRWPALYNPSYEIFVERTCRREQPLPGPSLVVYRYRGQCRKALAQKRHLGALRAACGRDPKNADDLRRRVAQEGRAVWMYLNYD